jgi:hypothetical protein
LTFLPLFELNMRWSKLAFVLASTLTAPGCAQLVSDVEQVYGTYRAEYSFGTETFTLQRDGSFIQEFKPGDGGEVLVRNGKWEFDRDHGTVTLLGCVSVSDGFGRRRTGRPFEGNCGYPVEQIKGRLRLGGGQESPRWKVPPA